MNLAIQGSLDVGRRRELAGKHREAVIESWSCGRSSIIRSTAHRRRRPRSVPSSLCEREDPVTPMS